jgi:hypothetical protein
MWRNSHCNTVNSVSAHGNFTATTPNAGTSMMYVPSTSGAVGFTNSTDSTTELTDDFGFYGGLVFVLIDGTIETEFFASPTTDADLWSLGWALTEDSDIAVAVRSVAPSTASI